MNPSQKQIARRLAIVLTAIGLGTGATYASFTSNQVHVRDNLVTTGQAAIKICDVAGSNTWGFSLGASENLGKMAPDEERELFPEHEIRLANDNGQLEQSLDSNRCPSYSETATTSTTALKILPNAEFAAESCTDTLPTHVRLRFEIDGVDTGYKTLNAWSTNTTSYEPALEPGGSVPIQMFAQLSSSATAQDLSCLFNIRLSGKQPTA